jgi:predicted DsbA family dithiol-disulfide isomerase
MIVCQDCAVLHERLQEMSHELFQVKRACTRLKGELRHERQERAKLLKKEKQHYRNGQKRGRTRNG